VTLFAIDRLAWERPAQNGIACPSQEWPGVFHPKSHPFLSCSGELMLAMHGEAVDEKAS
jgi:hypothetical protein